MENGNSSQQEMKILQQKMKILQKKIKYSSEHVPSLSLRAIGEFQNSEIACCIVLPPTVIVFQTPVVGRSILAAACGVVPNDSSK